MPVDWIRGFHRGARRLTRQFSVPRGRIAANVGGPPLRDGASRLPMGWSLGAIFENSFFLIRSILLTCYRFVFALLSPIGSIVLISFRLNFVDIYCRPVPAYPFHPCALNAWVGS